MDNTMQNDSLDNKLSAIDRALAAAAARKAAKAAAHSEASGALIVDSETSAEKHAKQKPTKDASAKAARDAEREAAREIRKSEREARRATKVTTAAERKPVHMKKVQNAAARLPELNDSMQLAFNEITTNFSASQITAIALHLQHFNRAKATERATNQAVTAGMQVQIIGGDPKFIGRIGTVELARRIRCFVNVPGINKPVYLFTSDVEVIEEAAVSTVAVG